MANSFVRRRRGNLSSAQSVSSIDSCSDVTIKEEEMPNPTNLRDCDSMLENDQKKLKLNIQELSSLLEELRKLRSLKEPLIRVKETLHEEISKSNIAINFKSEEVTQLKHKLRHHSERQIQDNIERLEFQLRNNNYKPREEQKILDEIFVLKRSFKTLKEFELKQRENKKYRAERSRLIENRNNVFSELQTTILQEDEIKRGMSVFREGIKSIKKTIEHLKNVRPEFEKAYQDDLKQKEQARLKRLEDKARTRKELYIKRQQEKQKRRDEYEASWEPYEDEKDSCRVLLSYVQSVNPSPVIVKNVSSDDGTTKVELLNNKNLSIICNGKSCGVFYAKSNDDEPKIEKKRIKRKIAKAKQKNSKVKDVPHPPDVIKNFDKLNISIPKTTEDIPVAIAALNTKLEYFEALGEAEMNEKKNPLSNGPIISTTSKESTDSSSGENSSLISNNNLLPSTVKPINGYRDGVAYFENKKADDEDAYNQNKTCKENEVYSINKYIAYSDNRPRLPNEDVTYLENKKIIVGLDNEKSFFSVPPNPSVSAQPKQEVSLTPTYASVTAKVSG